MSPSSWHACLTLSLSSLQGDCDFFAANLYARSVFGEDALANVSLERTADGQARGVIVILFQCSLASRVAS